MPKQAKRKMSAPNEYLPPYQSRINSAAFASVPIDGGYGVYLPPQTRRGRIITPQQINLMPPRGPFVSRQRIEDYMRSKVARYLGHAVDSPMTLKKTDVIKADVSYAPVYY